MAATFAVRASGAGSVHAEKVPGSFFDALIEITAGTGDYAAGGYAFGVTQLNSLFGGAYSTVESVEVVNHWTSAGTTACAIAVWDKSTSKVQAFTMGGAVTAGTMFAEIPNGNANLNGKTCTLRVRFC